MQIFIKYHDPTRCLNQNNCCDSLLVQQVDHSSAKVCISQKQTENIHIFCFSFIKLRPLITSSSIMSPTASHRMLPSTTETVQTKPFPIRGKKIHIYFKKTLYMHTWWKCDWHHRFQVIIYKIISFEFKNLFLAHAHYRKTFNIQLNLILSETQIHYIGKPFNSNLHSFLSEL